MRDLASLVTSLQADRQTLLSERFLSLRVQIEVRQFLARDNERTLHAEIRELTEQILNAASPPSGPDLLRQERFMLERERRVLTRELRMTPVDEWRDLQHLFGKAEDLTSQLREEAQRQERITTIMNTVTPYGSLSPTPAVSAGVYEPVVGGVSTR